MTISYDQTVSKGALQKATSILARDQLAGQTVVTSRNSLLHTWVVTAREQEMVWPEISLEVGKGEGTRAMACRECGHVDKGGYLEISFDC